MSAFDSFLDGLRFRTTHPSFEEGEQIVAFVTGYDEDGAIARIGDTILYLPDESATVVDSQVRLTVTEFDVNDHVGRGEIDEVIGESTY